MTERLDRIEAILLQNTSQISTLLEAQVKVQQNFIELQNHVDTGIAALRQAQQRTQEQLDAFIRDTRASIDDLVQMGLDTYQLVADNSNAIRTMQSEVRGLQVENRRILQELRDRRNNQGNA
jgi:hypothetical protein